MKMLIRLILSFSILLSSGIAPLFSTQQQEKFSEPTPYLSKAESHSSLHLEDIVFKSSFSGFKKGTFPAEGENIEEESESASSKKQIESGNTLAVLFFDYLLGESSSTSLKGFPFCKHFSHILSNRWHLFIQVFLI
ncbi:hypothetical protein [Echinicola vietnamensis]|uniref:Uncharacterized protein n=1 Tax=Echinicola vietnamensis (strain DSM 17526 / LMG 23754 / KMM 6221) TaxID=926556 RepID=L0FU42_ECHVK|nr:hypothetical protein [Echinicola vietnamensis]AGA76822.1 hypothetical protein Echvi_0543 [Echinicola vietnamensis DSM 17526]